MNKKPNIVINIHINPLAGAVLRSGTKAGSTTVKTNSGLTSASKTVLIFFSISLLKINFKSETFVFAN